MSKQELGTIIQDRRESLSLKQEDLAEMSGVTSKTIYLIEKGKGNPSIDSLQKLLGILGLEIIIKVKSIDE
jgi:transcriptional regulator with XRE-family HTH domain